jgi:hypothetical protein
MSKFKVTASISMILAAVLVAGGAAAGSFGNPGKITSLENLGHTGDKNYLVRGLSPGSGHGCANTDFATMIPAASPEQRELMTQTLLAAFLAGRTAQLETATTLGAGNCVQGRPVYTRVVLHP